MFVTIWFICFCGCMIFLLMGCAALVLQCLKMAFPVCAWSGRAFFMVFKFFAWLIMVFAAFLLESIRHPLDFGIKIVLGSILWAPLGLIAGLAIGLFQLATHPIKFVNGQMPNPFEKYLSQPAKPSSASPALPPAKSRQA